MAGTIVSTPALGASDWSGWITQQGLTDRGYMRVSLTNFSDSTASTIATGGVLECAGSIYSFTDTAIALATGTASASVAVYFYVIPSAGGTTCTIEMNSIAPTWRDDYQGFYASVASVTRVIGGCRILSATVFYNKFLYTSNIVDQCLRDGTTRPIFEKRFAIGEWNLDATTAKTVVTSNWPAGGTVEIIDLRATIVSDTQVNWYPLDYDSTSTCRIGTDVGTVSLTRTTGGVFDNNSFDGTASTIPNRGYVFIVYEA